MKIKMKVSTLALFAALNFTLVDLSETTFVYAPQTITVVDHGCEKAVSVDTETDSATGVLKITINDGCGLNKEVEIKFLSDLDLSFMPASKDEDEGYELRGVDSMDILPMGASLIDGDNRYPTKYELSSYQIEKIKALAEQEIASLSTVNGIILDDARDWYVCD